MRQPDQICTTHGLTSVLLTCSPFSVVAVELEELDGRRFFEFDAEVAGDLAQGVIEVREVVDGHVANEGAANFVVARAAMQPAEEEEKLEARGEGDDDPVGVHGFWVAQDFSLWGFVPAASRVHSADR